MFRWIALVVAVVGLSAAATLLVQYIPDPDTEPSHAVNLSKGPQPKIEIDEALVHDFGFMAQWDHGQHAWTIKNVGQGDLELWQEGTTSCSCTVVEFEPDRSKDAAAPKKKVSVKPNGSTKINLAWQTKEFKDKYHQLATIGTNDPTRPTVTISVTGFVHQPVVTVPPQAVPFSNISNEESTYVRIAVFSPDRPQTKIKTKTSRPALMVTSMEPLAPEDLKVFKVKSGYSVKLEIKPGMPLGRFKDDLIIETDHPLKPELTVALTGNVTGPISVVPQLLRMPNVPSRAGASQKLRIVVRGRRATAFKVLYKPEQLQIAIERENRPPAQGDYQLTATVPAGTAAGRVDDQIILETDHPKAGQIKIPVSIYVSNAGAG